MMAGDKSFTRIGGKSHAAAPLLYHRLDSVADSMGGGLSALVLERKDAGVNVAGENVDEMITESAEVCCRGRGEAGGF